MPAADAPSVAVVGAGLAGLAAAARLAKLGYPVTLFEARDGLGGSWAAYPLPGGDREVLVDDAPGVVGFPAPWRDLFRKSGRPLEAELARAGYALVPAGPARHTFADGSALVLPADRGEQHDALRHAYGAAAAGRWRDLLDGLDGVWQALRPLGLEAEREPRSLTREVRRRLWSRRTVADLAERVGHPRLGALVRSVAHRQGSSPERTPALVAVDLSLGRTFGRWQVEPEPGADGDVGRSSVLTEALVGRLRLRRVTVRTSSRVTAVSATADGGYEVALPSGTETYARVVLTVDPWEAARLVPAARDLRRAAARSTPAYAPRVRHVPADPSADAGETVALDAEGVPVVTFVRRVGGTTVASVHDHRRPVPRPGYGVSAAGFRGWGRRPGTRTSRPGLYLAGPCSPAGPGASAVVLSGALAAYAVAGRHD